MPKLRWGPSAFVLSAVALFIALGGTGYALTQTIGSSPTSQGALATKAAPAWHTLTLKNGWVYGKYSTFHVAYSMDAQGVVYLRGSAKNGNASMPAFTLPAGARPAHTLWLSVYAYDGAAGGLEIQHNGNASLFDAGGGATVRRFASLDGVSFRVP
jgi:hypothetical protein